MKLQLQYGSSVIVLPGEIFPDKMPPDASYLHVLLAVCAQPQLLSDPEQLYPAVAAKCRLPQTLVKNAVAYWTDCGIFTQTEQTDAPAPTPDAEAAVPEAPQDTVQQTPASAEEDPGAKKTPRASLPTYPAEEYARILSETDGLRAAIDECARIAGKLFSEHETRQLVALYDTYGLDTEYLMLLFMYCKNSLGKTTVSYVVRTGLGLYDDGIRTAAALEAHIDARDRARDNEYKIRRLFGLGERALTAKEKEYIGAWTGAWSMPMDVITRAYEITVKNIDTPRMSYVNKILSGWNENGIRTLEAVNAAEAEFEQQKAAKKQNKDAAPEKEASYDLNAFLELAMKRSFEDSN